MTVYRTWKPRNPLAPVAEMTARCTVCNHSETGRAMDVLLAMAEHREAQHPDRVRAGEVQKALLQKARGKVAA